MSKKVFISGPMTGLPGYNFQAFLDAEAMFRKNGWDVVNPVKVCMKYGLANVLSKPEVFQQMVDEELDELVSSCFQIYMLRGWEKSKGAKKELEAATQHGLVVLYQK